MAGALAACLPAAWATSAEVHGPVELTVNGRGQLCAHVRPGSPNESKQGWSVQVWQSAQAPAAGSRPAWQIDVEPGTAATAPWPDDAARCMVLPSAALKAGHPHLIEVSSMRLYRSRFCWTPAPIGSPARLEAVNEAGQCTTATWHSGSVGHALTDDGWWQAVQRWWSSLRER